MCFTVLRPSRIHSLEQCTFCYMICMWIFYFYLNASHKQASQKWTTDNCVFLLHCYCCCPQWHAYSLPDNFNRIQMKCSSETDPNTDCSVGTTRPGSKEAELFLLILMDVYIIAHCIAFWQIEFYVRQLRWHWWLGNNDTCWLTDATDGRWRIRKLLDNVGNSIDGNNLHRISAERCWLY